MKTATTRVLLALGLAFLLYTVLLALDVVAGTSNLSTGIAGVTACWGAAALRSTRRFRRKPLLVAVLIATALLFAGGASQLWLFALAVVSWPQLAMGFAFMGIAVIVFRSLRGRLVTEPYEPRGPGPLAPA